MAKIIPAALPYGVLDLDPTVYTDPGPPLRIRCFVQGCDQFLVPPARGRKGQVCPTHGIRCHQSATYSYQDVRGNIITAQDLLANGIVGHPFKFESHRLGQEKSEDALTYNVFRSFQEARCLNYVARLITGLDTEAEPRLFLWGIELTDDLLRPWDLLIAARQRFERKLPVKRPATEPDIGLFLPGEYLTLIEAKFTSPNSYYTPGPRKNSQSLTVDELLNVYADLTLHYLDREPAVTADRVYYQLWRNTVFAEYMAGLACPGTIGFFANLTRRGHETQSFDHFSRMVRPNYLGRVAHIFWEDLFVLAGLTGGKLSTLQEYLVTKTANLNPAFNFGLV
jgi:hypothetical protein